MWFIFLMIPIAILGAENPDLLWDSLKSELDWFKSYCKPPEIQSQEDPETAEIVRARFEREERYLRGAIDKANKGFLEFREQVATMVGATCGESSGAYNLHAQAELELTQFYKSYLEKQLFPMGWEESYKLWVEKKGLID